MDGVVAGVSVIGVVAGTGLMVVVAVRLAVVAAGLWRAVAPRAAERTAAADMRRQLRGTGHGSEGQGPGDTAGGR